MSDGQPDTAPRLSEERIAEVMERAELIAEATDDDAACASIRELVAELAAIKADVWQPIQTAPRDGTRVIVWAEGCDGNKPAIAFWWDGNFQNPAGWRTPSVGLVYPTHWIGIPEPPRVR